MVRGTASEREKSMSQPHSYFRKSDSLRTAGMTGACFRYGVRTPEEGVGVTGVMAPDCNCSSSGRNRTR
jgi:hypothetical protein